MQHKQVQLLTLLRHASLQRWLRRLLDTWKPPVTPLEAATTMPSIESARARTIACSCFEVKRCLHDNIQRYWYIIWYTGFAFVVCNKSARALTCVRIVHFLSLQRCEILHVHAVIPYCQQVQGVCWQHGRAAWQSCCGLSCLGGTR